MRILLAFCLVPALFFAQNSRDRISPLTIRGNVGVPGLISSAAFAKSFSGLVAGNVSASFRIGDNGSLGLGYEGILTKADNSLKQVSYNTSLPYYTSFQGNGVYLRIGYNYFFRKNAFSAFALNAGYMFCMYKDILTDTSDANKPFVEPKFQTPYIQPEYTVNWIMEPRLAFSVYLSYTTLLTHYDPKAPQLANVSAITSKSNNYFISYFTFGFGFCVLMGK